MWPLLIVNYVKLIELKRLLVYSKESCNNLANIIHGHRRFRLKRPLNDLHSAATGGSRPGRADERREGRCQSDGHLTRGWHNVTIPGSDPGVWVRHVTWTIALSQDIQTAESQGNMRLQTHCACVFCILDINAGVISGHMMPSPGSPGPLTPTRALATRALNCDYWLSQPARPSPRSPWWGPKVLWKYFYCAQTNFCQHKYIFPQRFQSRRGKNQVV